MRLSSQEVEGLVTATKKCFGSNARIWLFGSRTDSTKKGGDIDLYIETDLEEGVIDAKLQMRSQIWELFGDQKIDILIRSRNQDMSPMHIIAKENGVELKTSK